jgi:hypothetical protein
VAQKETLISRFPAGTNASGVITSDPRLDDLSESWNLYGSHLVIPDLGIFKEIP